MATLEALTNDPLELFAKSLVCSTWLRNIQKDLAVGKDQGRFLDLEDVDGDHSIGNVVAAVGAAVLLLGIGISMFTPKYPEMPTLIEACMKPSAIIDTAARQIACASAVFEFEKNGHTSSGFSTGILAANFLTALGTALLISILVSRTIETRNRRRFATTLDRKTRELSEAVMRGMFNRRHPERLIDLVSENILQRDLIREGLNVHYVFKRWKPSEGADITRLGDRRFIEVKATLTATMTNVSGSETLSGREADVPVCVVLPNPMYDELKANVVVTSVQIDGEHQGKDKLDEVNESIQKQLEGDPLTVQGDFGKRTLKPSQSLRLRMVYTMVKEIEDSEFFQTLQISKDLSITLVDTTDWDLKIRALAVGFGTLDEIASDDMTRQWSINDILLPHQGVNIWWKQKLPPKSLPGPNAGVTAEAVS